MGATLNIRQDRCPTISGLTPITCITRSPVGGLAISYTVLAMHTRQDLMRILGLSYPQLRTRLDALASIDNLLVGQVHKGLKGKLEYSPAVLAMLQDIQDLVNTQGMQVARAVEEVAGKVQGDSTTRDYQPDNSGINQLVEVLQRENHHLREEVGWLRARLEATSPALPKTRYRWPWSWRRG